MNTRQRIAMLVVVVVAGGILFIVVSRAAQPPSLPALLPLPSYLTVSPEPGQIVQLNSSPQGKNDGSVTRFSQPEDVCGKLAPISLLQPGDNFDFAYAKQQTSLVIDGKNPGEAYTGFDYDMLFTVPFTRGKATTSAFLLCWHGPREPGYHIATLTIRDQSYTWWYQIKE